MYKKKELKNDDILLNLYRFLIDIIKNPENFNNDEIIISLKSQANMSKYSNLEYNILPTSLNTLKRRSVNLFVGGFTELEQLREQAYRAILSLRIPVKNNKNKEKPVKILEDEIDNLKKSQILMTNLFLENLKVINSIKSLDSIDVIKKQLNDLSNKMKSYGLLDKNLLDLNDNSNISKIR